MDRAIALCVPQPADRQTFVSILIQHHQTCESVLKLHRLDAHALSSPQMQARGELCKQIYFDFATTLAANARYYTPLAHRPTGKDVSALQTSSNRLPPGEDTFTQQLPQQAAPMSRQTAFTLCGDSDPDDLTESSSDADDADVAALTTPRDSARYGRRQGAASDTARRPAPAYSGTADRRARDRRGTGGRDSSDRDRRESTPGHLEADRKRPREDT